MMKKKTFSPSTNITSYILISVLLLWWGVYSEGKEKKLSPSTNITSYILISVLWWGVYSEEVRKSYFSLKLLCYS